MSSNHRGPTNASAGFTLLFFLFLSIVASSSVGALSTSTTKGTHHPRRATATAMMARRTDECDRRAMLGDMFVRGGLAGYAAAAIIVNSYPRPALALVEGSKPQRKALGEEYRQGTAALGDSLEAESLPREAYKKLPSGVIYADISVGGGGGGGNGNDDGLVKEGSRVNVQWVLRRSNGYFVDSSAVSDSVPFIFQVGDPRGAIKGLDEGIRGMRAGGSRRILVPPSLAYVDGIDDGRPGPIPAGFGPRQQMRRVMEVRRDVPGEYIFLEVKVTKVR